MDAIVEKVIITLSSHALEEFRLLYNLNDDFRKMNNTISAIKAVLLDAEAKAINHQISDWLGKLRDVLYDADDLLDDFSFDVLRREVMTRNQIAKKVRIFFSKSNQVFYGYRMGSKMREIRLRLEEISDDKNKFHLQPNYSPNTPFEYKEWRETYSFVREHEVIGRELEKTCIVNNLLKFNVEDLSVISIVGIGGLGKTALAQLVYNDMSISQQFRIKMWICVSDDFSIKHIAQKILGYSTNGGQIEHVQQELRSKIKGKRFLLVLDDVWNEDAHLWLKLKSLLMEGAMGSKIIITTRSTKVADIMGTLPPFKLSGLDDERSWKLFCQMAFRNGEEPNNLKLRAIGKDIVKKCVGVPLAIRTIGTLLSQNVALSAWLNFRNMELPKIDEGEKQIFSILKLSYDHLPSQLKSCFAFCSMFPKDFTFERQILIQLWVAQGFIQQSDTIKNQEDVGNSYFMTLLSRSFFQDVQMDEWGEVKGCKMHDLMHDLAWLVSRDEYDVVTEGKEENIDSRVRHLSFGFQLNDWKKVPSSLAKANKLRTFLLPLQRSLATLDESVCHSIISNLKYARVIDFHLFYVKEIPGSIGKLKYLRYLDLSYSCIKMLPQGITNLHNLQTLKLNWCLNLEVLPRDIHKLVSLRHLELDGTNSLSCMPNGLGRLTCLQTLTTFTVSKNGGARINELGLLNNLSGSLSISGLEHMRGNTKEVESANLLLEKQYLQKLCLHWKGYDELEEVAYKDEMIFEALQPHPSIKALNIYEFCGKSLPDWIGNLSSLQKLVIWNCYGLKRLPESISNLSDLQYLEIAGCSDLNLLPESMGNLLSLLELKIRNCKGLTFLPDGMRDLKNLKKLCIEDCPQLAERCQNKGEDWVKIAHIPQVDVYPPLPAPAPAPTPPPAPLPPPPPPPPFPPHSVHSAWEHFFPSHG